MSRQAVRFASTASIILSASLAPAIVQDTACVDGAVQATPIVTKKHASVLLRDCHTLTHEEDPRTIDFEALVLPRLGAGGAISEASVTVTDHALDRIHINKEGGWVYVKAVTQAVARDSDAHVLAGVYWPIVTVGQATQKIEAGAEGTDFLVAFQPDSAGTPGDGTVYVMFMNGGDSSRVWVRTDNNDPTSFLVDDDKLKQCFKIIITGGGTTYSPIQPVVFTANREAEWIRDTMLNRIQGGPTSPLAASKPRLFWNPGTEWKDQ